MYGPPYGTIGQQIGQWGRRMVKRGFSRGLHGFRGFSLCNPRLSPLQAVRSERRAAGQCTARNGVAVLVRRRQLRLIRRRIDRAFGDRAGP
jgi:hypothetical protein